VGGGGALAGGPGPATLGIMLIALFTDFGWEGPYVGQVHAVLAAAAPGVPVVDLMHDAPLCAPRPAACLLAAVVAPLPREAVVVGVVDPGVGNPRRLPVVLEADGRWYVGPGNGLFSLVARQAQRARWHVITWRPERLSSSFHGRDLFAPVAARIAREGHPGDWVQAQSPADPGARWPQDLWEVIYVDRFGNLVTGVRAQALASARRLQVAGVEVAHAETFSAVPEGEVFWYANSMGLVEIACNRASAGDRLGAGPGTPVTPA